MHSCIGIIWIDNLYWFIIKMPQNDSEFIQTHIGSNEYIELITFINNRECIIKWFDWSVF